MINKLLHHELKSLKEKSDAFIVDLECFCEKLAKEDNKKEINKSIDLLKIISDQLITHLELDDTKLKSTNFYEEFQSKFYFDKHHKSVEYYIQDGYRDSPILITDEEILKKEFTINNCMASMKLIPMQLASNAVKYMPEYQSVKIVLVKTPRRNMITVSNLASKNRDKDLNNLAEEGVRGNNSSSMAGMGLGLSQVKSVIRFHEPILDSSFNIAQDTKTELIINNMEYVNFSVTISYLRTSQEPTESMNNSAKELFKNIPIIIIHNMHDIVANLISMTDKLKRYNYIDKNDVRKDGILKDDIFKNNEELKNDFISTVDCFKLNIENMQETIKLCLYIHNGYSTKNMLGNECRVNPGFAFKKEIELLYKHRYNNIKVPQIRINSKESISIDNYSVLFSIIYGLCDLVLSKATNKSQIDVEIDNRSIKISDDDIDFGKILYNEDLNEEPELEHLNHIRSRMYFDVLNNCGINLTSTDTTLTIDY